MERRTGLEWVSIYWSQLQKPSAHRVLGGWAGPSALLEERPRWEKGEDCFPCKPRFGMLFFNRAEHTFASLKLQASCFCYLKMLLGTDHLSITMWCFALFRKRTKFPMKKWLLQKGEPVWSGFQANEAHCKYLVPTEHMAGYHLHQTNYKRVLGGKKGGIPFHLKPSSQCFFA